MSNHHSQLPQKPTALERAALSLEGEDDNDGGGSREEKASISTLMSDSMSPTPPTTAAADGLDGSGFLKFLRAAGAFSTDVKTEDTFGSSNKKNTRQDLRTLSELFEAPAGATNGAVKHMSNEDTIGRSNTTSTAPEQPSLAILFEDPSQMAPQAPFLKPTPAAPAGSTAAAVNNSAAAAVPPPRSSTPPQPSSAPTPPHVSPKSVLKTTNNTTSRSPSTSTLSPNSGNESMHRNAAAAAAGGLPPRPNPQQQQQQHGHNRSVSWGNNTTFRPNAEAASALDHLGDQRGEEYGHLGQAGRSFDSVSSLDADHNHRRINTRTQFTLEDLMGNGPYEAEAESNIIRALEAQQAVRGAQRARSNSIMSASLLGQVPENAAHDFSMDESEPSRLGSMMNAPVSPRSAATATSSKNGTNDSEKVKLLHNKNKQARQRHQRHLSVEMTLVGLTEAMSALHGSEGKAKTRQPDEPFSSADMFAENANRLSEHQQPNNNNNGIGAASNHARNRVWRIDNLPMVDEHRQSNDSATSTEDGDNVSSDGNRVPDLEAGRTPTTEDGEEEEDRTRSSESKATGARKNRKNKMFGEASDKLKNEWDNWRFFLKPRKSHIRTYSKNMLIYIVLPLMGVAAILFYLCGNPSGGRGGDIPSISWWLLFTVRQVITLSMALAMQGLVVDYLSLGTKIMLNLVGPIVTLLIVQAKGWPFICFWWAMFDFAMLASGGRFARHWGFWQDFIGLFNEENPSGTVASNEMHITMLTVVASLTSIVAVKRFVIGLYLGRQTFTHYGEKLASVMNSMLLVSEVADLAKDIARARVDAEKIIPVTSESFGWNGGLRGVVFPDDGTVGTHMRSMDESNRVIDATCRDPLTGSLPAREKAKLMQLLGQWEEPTRASDPRQIEIASISAVLRFRKALTFIQKKFPFSYAFGPADTREHCIESAQTVYERLLRHNPEEEVLQFETLALLALLDDDGESIDHGKAKRLVKLFRPDREGQLTMLDFVKSVDSVYKEFRMLNASIQNSSQIDRAFENIFNVAFYITMFTVTLSFMGFNPLALFLSLSSVILAFAFMIGSASSKYFEGVLFILVRRPYGIGDRIHVSDVEKDTSIEGAPGWVVENVTLFETVATWTPTRERCSLSNGSLANSRIINAARSPQAQFHLFLKFHIDEPYEKILIFKAAIEEYMRARPREWLALNGFRAVKIVADQGYVEYAIVIQHRESWQNVGQILDSKANLSSYCNEVAKQLSMHYRAPPLPVDLRYLGGGGGDNSESDINNMMQQVLAGGGGLAAATAPTTPPEEPKRSRTASASSIDHSEHQASEIEREAQMKQFRHIALNKHNIRLN